jgi:hypothetical protein
MIKYVFLECNNMGKMKKLDHLQGTISKNYKKRDGIIHETEVDFLLSETERNKGKTKKGPFRELFGMLKKPSNSDVYIEHIRGK